MTKIVPIDSRVHKNTKIKADPTFAFSADNHIVPIVIHEILAAAHEFPIMFFKDNGSDKFRLCGVLGLKAGQNLLRDDKGWKGSYVPAALKAYPFAMMKHPEDETQRLLCLDADSSWINEEEGVSIFDEDGKRTEYIEKLGSFLLELNQRHETTDNFVSMLVENDLLEEKTLEIGSRDQEKYKISGIFVINETKFNELDDSVYLQFRKNGFVGAVYAILMSMSRINRLLNLAAEAGETFTPAKAQ